MKSDTSQTLTRALVIVAVLVQLANATSGGRALTTRTVTSNWFEYSPDNVGIVTIERLTDPSTGITSTTLWYSFCIQTTASSCLEGGGTIPNSDFSGNAKASSGPDVLTLEADTNIAGFDNHLCLGPNPFEITGCDQGTAPATGGIISLIFAKTRSHAETFTYSDLEKRDGRVVLDTTGTTYEFSQNMVGTVIGSSATNSGILIWDTIASGKVSAKSKALENWLAGQPLGLQMLRRLQVLSGKGH